MQLKFDGTAEEVLKTLDDIINVLDWLISDKDEYKETGRTEYLINAFIKKALENKGQIIRYFNHNECDIYYKIKQRLIDLLINHKIDNYAIDTKKSVFIVNNIYPKLDEITVACHNISPLQKKYKCRGRNCDSCIFSYKIKK